MGRTSAEGFGRVGLAGLGLMGRGIAACLLANGLRVTAYNRTAGRAKASVAHIGRTLDGLVAHGLAKRASTRDWKERFALVRTVEDLRDCAFVIESVKEDLDLKRGIYDRLESAAGAGTVIASNTSAYPVALLQEGRIHPERFIVMHWAEPAAVTRYLEIVPGEKTTKRAADLTKRLGILCGKEPTALKRDIRGFISNRLMYAMMREACHLVESGVADVETVDRSFRNDIGWWAALAGPFRWMDLTGIGAYATVMEGLFPDLADTKTLPRMMKRIVAEGAQGISNAKGFYRYTKRSAREWEKIWTDFTIDIRKLVERYAQRAP